MSGVRFYPSGGTSLAPGVVLPSFTANTIPYINGSQEVAEDVNFTYQSGQLGIGISSSLGATVHIKGANDSTGANLIVQSATYEVLKAYNSRNLNIGGGTVSAGTDYKITAFGTASADSHSTLTITGYNNDNIFKFYNTNGYTRGGLEITRTQYSYSRNAITIIGASTIALTISSSGVIGFNNTSTIWADTDGNYIQPTTSATHGANTAGMLYNTLGGGAAASHIFRNGRGITSTGTGAIVHLYSGYTENSVFNTTTPMLKIAPAYDLSGAGVKHMIGVLYAPTLTAMTGGNYAFIGESGLSGFSLGSSVLPTALVHVGAGTTAISQMKLESSTAPTGGALTDGCFWYDGTDLKFRTGGVTKTVTLV